MNRWIGKIAVVTGASAGIGAAISEQLVEAGVKVVGLARRKHRLDDLSEQFSKYKGSFHGIACDVSKEEDVLSAFKWIKDNLGPISILINNAGVIRNTNLIEGDTKMWRELFDTNVIGLCVATREAVKDMRANGVDGHIIHINSLSGHRMKYNAFTNVYPATKYAVTALTETLRQELNSINSKIKITSISPGVVETDIWEAGGVNYVPKSNPFDMLQPKDIADAVMYVVSTPPHVQIHEIMIRPIGQII